MSDALATTPDGHDPFDGLPAYPASREAFEAWAAWGERQLASRRVPTIAAPTEPLEPAERARHIVSWRAVLAAWARHKSVAPDDAPVVAHQFLMDARAAGPFPTLAARRLVDASMAVGSTSTDVMYLCAAFAWPLRDTDPERSERCWRYLIHAPWQTDAPSVKDMLLGAESHHALSDGRSLEDLADARLEAGATASALTLLEAAALIQSRREHLGEVASYRDFLAADLVHGANAGLVRLARIYVDQARDEPHAREVIKRAAELTRSFDLITHVETRVWDRSLDEAYAWSEKVSHPRQVDDEVDRALSAGQPHHARRLAEAVLVRAYGRRWYGPAQEHVPAALERFQRQLARQVVPSDPIARRAAEHLATLYVRTHHVTQPARHFVHDVASSIAFTGEGAALRPIKGELERFFNLSDPYHVLRRDAEGLAANASVMSDDERLASDEVQRWFSDKFRRENPRLVDVIARALTAPLMDAARLVGGLPLIEGAVLRALAVAQERGPALAGDLDAIALQAARIRSEYGYGAKLMTYAEEVTRFEALSAAATAASLSFLPPALGPAAHATDLGASLMLTWRALARVGAVFGRNIHSPDGLQLVADSLTLGLSSAEGEGLVTYLSRGGDEVLTAFTVGAVGYGAARLAGYLWVAPGAPEPTPSARLTRHLARYVGVELSHAGAARVVPIVGAVLRGASTYWFVRSITDAAIHVAARDALLVRRHTYEET